MSIAVIHAVAHRFNVTPDDLTGRSRHQYLVGARAIAAYIMRHRYEMSYPRIGARLGGRDHSTIIHLCRVAERLMNESPSRRTFVNRHLAAPKLAPPLGAFRRVFVPSIDVRVTNPEIELSRRIMQAEAAFDAEGQWSAAA